MSLIGIFEHNDGYYWMDCLDEYEIKEVKYFVDDCNCASIHCCVRTIIDNDMDGYVDTLQNEETSLVDGELYVVTYHHAFMDCGYWNLEGLVDFGLTKDEIIENVKNQKYVEGAACYTMGQMFYETRKMMEDSWDYYEVEFGILADGAQTGDYESPYSMCIKARHWLSLEEAEKHLANDMKMYGCDCVHSVTKISEKEMIGCFDLSDVDNWPILG